MRAGTFTTSAFAVVQLLLAAENDALLRTYILAALALRKA